jgi:hypothetical protein
MADAAAVAKVYAALRATWEELGQEHHDGYIDETEVKVLTDNLIAQGARF